MSGLEAESLRTELAMASFHYDIQFYVNISYIIPAHLTYARSLIIFSTFSYMLGYLKKNSVS